jgi:integrase
MPGTYYFSWTEGGKRKQRSLETSDLAEAIERAAAIIRRVEVGRQEGMSKGGKLSTEIEIFLERKVAAGKFSVESAKNAKSALAELLKIVGDLQVSKISTHEIEAWWVAMRTEIRPRTRKVLSDPSLHSYLRWVRSFFSTLAQDGKIKGSPAAPDMFRPARPAVVSRQKFSDPKIARQLDRVRDRALEYAEDDDMRFILFCGFYAGMRKKEIVQARPDWFDLEGKVIRIRNTESFTMKARHKPRVVPMHDRFRHFLESYGLRHPFMLKPDRARAKKSTYRYDFRVPFAQLMKKINFRWATPHDMRHAFASKLLINGATPATVAAYMGDSVKVVLEHYGHLVAKHDDIMLLGEWKDPRPEDKPSGSGKSGTGRRRAKYQSPKARGSKPRRSKTPVSP